MLTDVRPKTARGRTGNDAAFYAAYHLNDSIESAAKAQRLCNADLPRFALMKKGCATRADIDRLPCFSPNTINRLCVPPPDTNKKAHLGKIGASFVQSVSHASRFGGTFAPLVDTPSETPPDADTFPRLEIGFTTHGMPAMRDGKGQERYVENVLESFEAEYKQLKDQDISRKRQVTLPW